LPFAIGRRWLPLAEYVAVALADAILEDDVEQRRARLLELLRQDPPLALWTLLQARKWRDAPPGGIGELADWLSPRLLNALAWPAEVAADASSAAKSTPRGWPRFARMAGERVALARAAGAKGDGELAFLTALLLHPHEWFDEDDSTKDGASEVEASASMARGENAALPPWLESAENNASLPVPDEDAREAGKAIERKWKSLPLAGRGGLLLRRLTASLRRLRDLEQEFSATLEREKLDALKELAYGASHEINNPLANISTRAQTLLRDETDPERRKKLATINSQAFRAHEMIADMMLFARPPRLELKAVDLHDVVTDVLAELAPQAAAQGTQLVARIGKEQSAAAIADGTQLRVALHAVVRNALEAVAAGGRVDVALETSLPDNGEPEGCPLRIVVSDTGPGISPEVRRHLFDPFYSGREAGRGLGFGLSKCWRILVAHGGRIDVESESGRGAKFVLCLPRGESGA
jgi:hypothetical protein